MPIEQLSIVGVGLIGGSVGLAAKARGVARRVIGVGRSEPALARAADTGAIDSYTTDLAAGVAAADLIVVCTPVDRIAADVLAVARAVKPAAVITDAGSTKARIVAELAGKLPLEGAIFVGSHPLAGSEKKGADHARPDLFAGRVVILTPTPETDPAAVAAVDRFWQALGARTMRLTPGEHDAAIAVTSHLPHAVAAGAAGLADEQLLRFAAGGFKDTTRVAAGDPELWAAIFDHNREAVADALRRFSDRMDEFRRALEAGDRAALVRWLADAKRVRDALGS